MKKTSMALLALVLGAVSGYVTVTITNIFAGGFVFGIFASIVMIAIFRKSLGVLRYIVFVVGSGIACYAAEIVSAQLLTHLPELAAFAVAGLVGGFLTMASFAIFKLRLSAAKNIGFSLLSAAIALTWNLGVMELFVIWQSVMLLALTLAAMSARSSYGNIIGDGKLAPSEAMPVAESLSSQLFPERTHQNPPQQG